MKVWLLGHVKDHVNPDDNWVLGGLFSSEQKAVEACTDEWDFIWSEDLDDNPGRREQFMETGYYPLAKADE